MKYNLKPKILGFTLEVNGFGLHNENVKNKAYKSLDLF